MNQRQFEKRLKHRVGWKKKTSTSGSQQEHSEGPTYGASVTIPAFKLEDTITAGGPGGAETRSADKVWVTENVEVGALIDDVAVEAREAIEDARRGERIGYKLYLEPS